MRITYCECGRADIKPIHDKVCRICIQGMGDREKAVATREAKVATREEEVTARELEFDSRLRRITEIYEKRLANIQKREARLADWLAC